VIKAEFSASLLQSSVSHDPSQIILIWWFTAQLQLVSKFLSGIIIILNLTYPRHLNDCASQFPQKYKAAHFQHW